MDELFQFSMRLSIKIISSFNQSVASHVMELLGNNKYNNYKNKIDEENEIEESSESQILI